MQPVLPPPDHADDESRTATWLLISLLAVGVGFALFVFLFSRALPAGGFGGAQGGFAEGPELIFPDDAPAGDRFVALTAINASGEQVDNQLAIQFGNPAEEDYIEGSGVHLATAKSRWGSHDLYMWSVRFRGAAAPTLCAGQFGDTSGSAGCGFENPDAVLGGGGGSSSNGRQTINNYSVHHAPEGAQWLVMETTSGARIVSNVEVRSGFVEWDDRLGGPDVAFLLDKDLNEIWTERVQR